ncbi:MAG: DUF4838 domain-containing protein [Bryobacteraceae bacterium]
MKTAAVLFLVIAAAQGATLVRNGKATSVIVVPDREAAVAREAARLLQGTLLKMTGAKIPIEPEGRAGTPAPAGRVWISAGDTRFARSKGIAPEALRPEEIRVVAAPGYVIVAGNDSPADDMGREPQQGSYFAAVELLERLGVRWLWPGKSGEVVPRRATVSVAPFEYAFFPRVTQRRLRFGPDRGAGQARYGIKLADAGLDWGEWPRHMRLGYSRRIGAGHAFGDWYEKYFKEHPEYFAVGEDGKSFGWLSNVQRSKLCVSNPGVLEQVVKLARDYYSRSRIPQATCFSVSPTDSQAGHCMCPNCRKMDALDGPKEEWNFNTGEGGRNRSVVRHVSLTDRYLTFWNRVAERLEKECPHLLLSGIAYGVYRHPPLHTRAHKNLVITYVGGDYTNDALRRSCLKEWDEWAVRADRMMFRPNLMREGRGFPLIWPVRMAEDLRHFCGKGMISVDIANIHGHWATQGLNYYVLAKTLWNPDLDAWALIDDYCRRGFGAAAAPIRKYYGRLIELTDRVAAYNGEHEPDAAGQLARGEATAEDARARRKNDPITAPASAWEVVYTPAVMKELEGYLRDARRLAAREPDVRERVKFLSLGFEFAGLDLKMKQSLGRHDRDPRSREKAVALLKAVVEVEEWRKRHAGSAAVGTVVGSYWFAQQLLGTPAARFAPVVLAEKQPGGDYRLEVLAYSRDRRIAAMQLSHDGRQWSAARPYEPRITWRGQGRVFVRFQLEGEEGAEWSKPVQAEL